jgi:hypothetical protein
MLNDDPELDIFGGLKDAGHREALPNPLICKTCDRSHVVRQQHSVGFRSPLQNDLIIRAQQPNILDA